MCMPALGHHMKFQIDEVTKPALSGILDFPTSAKKTSPKLHLQQKTTIASNTICSDTVEWVDMSQHTCYSHVLYFGAPPTLPPHLTILNKK